MGPVRGDAAPVEPSRDQPIAAQGAPLGLSKVGEGVVDRVDERGPSVTIGRQLVGVGDPLSLGWHDLDRVAVHPSASAKTRTFAEQASPGGRVQPAWPRRSARLWIAGRSGEPWNGRGWLVWTAPQSVMGRKPHRPRSG